MFKPYRGTNIPLYCYWFYRKHIKCIKLRNCCASTGNGYWLLLSASIGVQRILGIDQSVAMLSVAKNKLINYPFVEVLESDIT